MYDRAHDGFTTTLNGVPFTLGCLAALILAALVVLAVVLLIDTLIGTIEHHLKPIRLRRAWRRTGRTTPR